MQKMVVARKESKPTAKGGTMVALFDEKGTRFSGFLPELKEVNEGDEVEMDIQVDGKYLNIMGVKILGHSEPKPVSNGKSSYGQDSPEKRRSIERQTAATLAFGFAAKEGCTDTVVGYLKIAEQIYQWISAGTIPPDKPTTTPEKTQPVAQKAPVGSGQPESLLDQALKCKDGIELYNFAFKHGHTLVSIQNAGLSKDPKAIKSVEAAAKVLFPDEKAKELFE